MPGSYLVYGGVPHAKAMLAYHRDGVRTATTMLVVWTAVFGFEAFMFLTSNSHPFAFGAGFALLLIGFGVWLRVRHGRKVRRWQATLNHWEAIRKDRLIHARTLKGWEL